MRADRRGFLKLISSAPIAAIPAGIGGRMMPAQTPDASAARARALLALAEDPPTFKPEVVAAARESLEHSPPYRYLGIAQLKNEGDPTRFDS